MASGVKLGHDVPFPNQKTFHVINYTAGLDDLFTSNYNNDSDIRWQVG